MQAEEQAAALHGRDLWGRPLSLSQGPVAQRFLLMPADFLDGRSGWWAERCRAWLACGIKSELGREGNLLDWGSTILAQTKAGTSIFDPTLTELAYR